MNPCQSGLGEAVVRSLDQYFQDLDGQKPVPVYDMVLKCVERPLFEYILERAKGNQSAAAQVLGINRNTLRRKLVDYDLL
ncbi:MAG: Fis family transcriptional regulator [Azoarcus sp.]|jgi:Fis family transcriptional regulator|nr:Fis family transcriptional regulator [Azoarcus sp.]